SSDTTSSTTPSAGCTDAVFSATPEPTALTTIGMSTDSPAARSPGEHVTTPVSELSLQLPSVPCWTKLTFSGSVSLTVQPLATSGPPLCTVSVYVKLWPLGTLSTSALFVIPSSTCVTCGTTCVEAGSESSALVAST